MTDVDVDVADGGSGRRGAREPRRSEISGVEGLSDFYGGLKADGRPASGSGSSASYPNASTPRRPSARLLPHPARPLTTTDLPSVAEIVPLRESYITGTTRRGIQGGPPRARTPASRGRRQRENRHSSWEGGGEERRPQKEHRQAGCRPEDRTE